MSRLASLLLLLTAACASAPDPVSTERAPSPTAAAPPDTAGTEAGTDASDDDERFDLLVREDFFAGLLEADEAALERAMRLCEETLARDPDHAQAMVWHGAGVILRARAAFQAHRRDEGIRLWQQGLAEMDRAVELAPDDVGTRIPRGATLLAAAPFVPEAQRIALLDKGLSDYEEVLRLQQPYFDRLSRHARSQLLHGLADGWHRRGDTERARAYFARLAEVAGDSAYGERARAYLAGDTAPRPMACGGCHAAP